jgi:hypothetical protein
MPWQNGQAVFEVPVNAAFSLVSIEKTEGNIFMILTRPFFNAFDRLRPHEKYIKDELL